MIDYWSNRRESAKSADELRFLVLGCWFFVENLCGPRHSLRLIISCWFLVDSSPWNASCSSRPPPSRGQAFVVKNWIPAPDQVEGRLFAGMTCTGMVFLAQVSGGMHRKLLKPKELCLARRRRDAECERPLLSSNLCASASLRAVVLLAAGGLSCGDYIKYFRPDFC